MIDRAAGRDAGARAPHASRPGSRDDGADQVVHARRRHGAARGRRRARLGAPGRDPDRGRAAPSPPAPPERGLRYLPPEQTTDTDLSVIRAGGDRAGPRAGAGVRRPRRAAVRGARRAVRARPVGSRRPALRALRRGADAGRRLAARGALPRQDALPAARRAPAAAAVPRRRSRPTPLVATGEPVDMATQVWPLMAKEIAWGWYHELFVGHPEQVRAALGRVRRPVRRARVGLGRDGGAARRRRARPAGPARPRRRCDRPLDGAARVRSGRAAAAGPRRGSPRTCASTSRSAHTPHLGAFVAMLSVYAETTRLAGSGALTARSRAVDMAWWQSFFNSVASGPPGFRVREMLALCRAGFVHVPRRRDAGRDRRPTGFRARQRDARRARRRSRSTVLVDARLPDPSAVPHRRPAARRAVRARRGEPRTGSSTSDGTVLRNTGLLGVRPGGRRRARRRGPPAPAPVRRRAAHDGEGGRRVHPARHERAEPALQRRRRPRRAARACRSPRRARPPPERRPVLDRCSGPDRRRIRPRSGRTRRSAGFWSATPGPVLERRELRRTLLTALEFREGVEDRPERTGPFEQ